MFSSALLERVLRPLLDDAGEGIGRLLRRLGIETGDLDRRLELGWPGMSAPQFRGQQLATGAVALRGLPGDEPARRAPVRRLAALGLGRRRSGWASRRRAGSWAAASAGAAPAVLAELPVTLDLFVIAASAGLSPEQALVEAGRQLERRARRRPARGRARVRARHCRLRRGAAGAGASARASPSCARWPTPGGSRTRRDCRSRRRCWRSTETVRERRRARLLEEGGKAEVRMLFPVALFIFPVFLVVLLYPAGVALLGLGN